MPTTYWIEHGGRRIEVVPDRWWESNRVRLLIDGEPVEEAKLAGERVTLSADGVDVRLSLPWHGARIRRAELLRAGEKPLELDAVPGSALARRIKRERPGLWEARHIATGLGQALVAILGITLAVRLIPALPLPSIPLPSIDVDLPEIPFPDVDPPDLEAPGWIRAILGAKEIWLPILVGLALAARERRRRKERQAQE